MGATVKTDEAVRKRRATGDSRPASVCAAGRRRPTGREAARRLYAAARRRLDRPPDWRWQLARRLAADRLPAPSGARRLAAAVAVLRGATAAAARVAAAAAGVNAGPPAVRIELEARLLAGQPAVAAAPRVGVPAAVAAAYAALFYDVPAAVRRTTRAARLVPPDVGLGADGEPPAERVLKHAALGGLAVLEAVLRHRGRPRPPVPRRLAGLADADLADLALWLTVRAYALSLCYVPRTDREKLRLIAAALGR